jgi:hypothetical protein
MEANNNPEISEMKEKLRLSEARIGELAAENKKLHEEIEAVLSKKSAEEQLNEFAEASGVLWKRKPSGGYESIPYCPTCKSTLADYSGSLLCLKCNWQAPLKSFEAPKVHHDLFG